tara:strand:- start:1797 stop:2072 length:276 start_codon:yes stop_codon:yes gene_type:complete
MLVSNHCQTCGEPIGHLYEPYLELVQKYADELKVDLNPDSGDDSGNEGRPNKPSPEYMARQDLIDKNDLDGRRECCLYALFVNYDITDIVN